MADAPMPTPPARLSRGRASRVGGRLALIVALITGVALVASAALLTVVVPAGAKARDTVRKLGDVPPLQEALPSPPQTSVIYAADGKTVLARLVLDEDRKVVPLKDIPRRVRNAVVAIEDDRFYEHGGIDMRGILRAAVADLRKGSIAQGGSTLTQQYIKKVVTGDSRTLDRKIREAMYAVELERRWSKNQILEAYLNQAYFGDGVYGIATAAQHYFGGKSVRKLTLAEAAALAATVQAPNRLKPTRPRDNKPRRMAVLDRMLERGYATPRAVAKAKREKLKVTLHKPKTRQPYFVEYIKQQLLHDPAYDKVLGREDTERRKRMVFQGGLKIYTTLQPRHQAEARAAIRNQLWTRFGKNGNPTGAVASVDPNTGRILALYGGRENFKRSQVDLATARGGSGFQPGSSFKVFYLVAALEKGITPARVYKSPARITIPDRRCYTGFNTPWTLGNAGDGEAGVFNMYQATAHSVNTYFAQLAMDVGIERAIETARRMGISVPPQGSEDYDRHWAVCSSVLGVVPVSVLDMASAYGVLANNGVRCPPFSIARIDRPGKTLFERRPTCTRVIEPKIAATVTAMLRGVVTGGTGRAAALPGRPVAGKTGTAQEYQSAFFNGYTPQMATSVWVGFTPKPVPMRHQNGGRPVFGGTFPAMIFHDYMAAALSGAPVEGFPAAPPPPPPPVPPTTKPPPGTKPPRGAKPPGRPKPPPTTRRPNTVIVPGVVGLPIGQARAVLSGSGLGAGLAYTSGRPGRVAAQSPGAGGQLPRGSSVILMVGRRS
jgi:membrane peptidoglycan carboxypeptidase